MKAGMIFSMLNKTFFDKAGHVITVNVNVKSKKEKNPPKNTKVFGMAFDVW